MATIVTPEAPVSAVRTAQVTIVAIGGLLMPALLKEKYTERFSLGIITSTGSIGLLFPPSLPIILYSVIASQHASKAVQVEDLFKAALIPGVLLVTLVSVFSIAHSGLIQKIRSKPFEPWQITEAWWLESARWKKKSFYGIPFYILGGLGSIFLGILLWWL